MDMSQKIKYRWHLKNLFNALTQQENTNQTTLKFHPTLVKMAMTFFKKKNGEDVEKINLIHCWWKCELV